MTVVWIGTHIANSAIGLLLQHDADLQECRSSLMNRNFTTEEACYCVDFTAVGNTNCAAPQLFSLLTCKHVSGFKLMNKIGLHWGIAEDYKYPCCNAPVESSNHHTVFPQRDHAAILWHDVEELLPWMETAQTETHLQAPMITYLFKCGSWDF